MATKKTKLKPFGRIYITYTSGSRDFVQFPTHSETKRNFTKLQNALNLDERTLKLNETVINLDQVEYAKMWLAEEL